MNPSSATELDVPPIMRIGAARMTAGLDRMTRLDLEAHTEIFGPLPRMSADELIEMAEEVLGVRQVALPQYHGQANLLAKAGIFYWKSRRSGDRGVLHRE